MSLTTTRGHRTRRWRLATAVVACVATVTGMLAAPVSAGAQSSPGYPGVSEPPVVDSAGCPLGGPAGVGAPQLQVPKSPPGQHCLPLSSWSDYETQKVDGGGCEATEYVFVELPPEINAYVVWVTGAGISGWYPQWLTGGTIYPDVLKGYGDMSFGQVPKGEAGWAAGGGGGGGDCAEGTTNQGPLAWGVSYKWAVGGTITVASNGSPAEGMTVAANCPKGGSGTTTTNPKGYYEFLVSQGLCTITPQPKNGFRATPENRSILVEENITNANFTVPCAGTLTVDCAEIEGGIRTTDGKPVSGVTVDLTGTQSATTTTNDVGHYSFLLPKGTYTVTPQMPSNLSAVEQDTAYQYQPEDCPGGSLTGGACGSMPLSSDQDQTVNFEYGCGVQGVKVTKVEPKVAVNFGVIPYSTVELTGKGFCSDMEAFFGNPLAETDNLTTSISDGGTQASVTVPRLATTGTVRVWSAGHTGTLDNVAADSFRNVYGFNFGNTDHLDTDLTLAEFEHVFTNATITESYNACPPGNCPAHATVPNQVIVNAYYNEVGHLDGGLCFGIVLGAGRMAPGGDLTPQSLDPDANTTYDIPLDDGVLEYLADLQVAQDSDQMKTLLAEARATDAANSDGAFLMNEIRYDTSGPSTTGNYGTGVFIGLSQTVHGEVERHAVLGFNLEDNGDSGNLDSGVIDVYNPNLPFDPDEDTDSQLHKQYADLSRLTIHANGTWSLSGPGTPDWSGPAAHIAIVPVSTLISTLNAGLTIGAPGGASVQPGPGTAVVSLTAPDGKAVDLASGGSQGVAVLPSFSASSAQPSEVSFLGPSGTYVEKLVGHGSLNETVAANGVIYTVNAGAGTAGITIDASSGTITIGPAPGAAPPKTATLAIEYSSNGNLTTASISGSVVTPMSLEFNSSQAVITAPAHRAKVAQLTLTGETPGSPLQAFSSPLTVPAGEVAAVSSPSWSAYTGAALTATVGRAGKPAQPVTLTDHTRPAAEAKLTSVKAERGALRISLSMPALPSGSTAQLSTTFLNSRDSIEHRVTEALRSLGHASTRTVTVRFPSRLSAGSEASVTLVANVSGANAALTTSNQTLALGGLAG
ncbi:MAG TPA: carboxypeptidase regulatory-like domain-containing protein [Acidimicrobiales bacterium]|nr:carboxypeptidase regulatory-like domain-containing protein [Acidimicrobiales bacterium]